MTTLCIGSRGAEVAKLQEDLVNLGLYRGPVDGDYGSNTEEAVKKYQTAFMVDGIADEVTQDSIKRSVSSLSLPHVSNLLFPVPKGLKEVVELFGKIEFVEAGGGTVKIVGDWAANHIIVADLPVVGKQQIHKTLHPVFLGMMQTIKDRGLDRHIRQFGCWSPRHKMHDPKRTLSTHSWAIAFDVNWATNPVGVVGDLPKELVEVITAYGFEWGGNWAFPDWMHFQYCTGY